MPNAYLIRLSKKHKMKLSEVERYWDKAKKLASDEGKNDNFKYITGILKRMLNESEEKGLVSFSEYISEARRNPDQNPKISAYEALKVYKDDPSIFISFTDNLADRDARNKHGLKLGINPQSMYNTPIGIYCYNLKEAWDIYDVDKKKSLRGLPFAADRPFIWVMKGKIDDNGFIIDMYTDYDSSNYDKDIKILKKIWDEKLPAKGYKDVFISYIWEYNMEECESQIRKYQSIVDDMVNSGEDKIVYDVMEKKLDKYKKIKEQLLQNRDKLIKGKMWDDFIQRSLDSAKEKNPVMSFWNITRLMGIKLGGEREGISAATQWNWLLRQCGYIGFSDLSMKGYIHPSEPMQTVFLTYNGFKVLDVVMNKDYKDVSGFASVSSLLLQVKEDNITIRQVLALLNSHYDDDFYDLTKTIRITVSYKELLKTMGYEESNWILVNAWKYINDKGNTSGYKQNVQDYIYSFFKRWFESVTLSGDMKKLEIWYNKIVDYKIDWDD